MLTTKLHYIYDKLYIPSGSDHISLHLIIVDVCLYVMKAYMVTLPHSSGESSTVRLSHNAKVKLVKIGARLALKDGDPRSMEEVIELLIKEYEKNHKEEL